jgi:predicted GH43/DUF377 family glycosyl hydrolase
MKWKKLGLIFAPDGSQEWMYQYASVPCPILLDKGKIRVFFGTRDRKNRSHIGFVEFYLSNPHRIVKVSQETILPLGALGAFDDSGTMPSHIIQYNNMYYLYYIGWNLGVTVPFRNAVGLAVSHDGVNFKKMFPGPVLDRTKTEPYFVASSHTLIENKIWRLWYTSCQKWQIEKGKPKHLYHIKYAESKNGIDWQRYGKVAIDFLYPNEYAISSPRVIKEKNKYLMWYSYRGSPQAKTYRIGYAESIDGIKWMRKDRKAGIDVSPTGWDCEMIEYPNVFDYQGQRYMLYCGNNYGKTGFGLAKVIS